jgi:hypothetical protein
MSRARIPLDKQILNHSNWYYMTKKKVLRTHRTHKAVRQHKTTTAKAGDVSVFIQGWMFVVAFALMLGLGAIVGTYFNSVSNGGVPTVAGATISR